MGLTIGAYRVIERLPRGHPLFVAHKEGEGTAAVRSKYVLSVAEVEEDEVERVWAEVERYASVRHAAIAPVVELFEHEGSFVLAIEHGDGVGLDKLKLYLERDRERLPDAAIWYMGQELVGALAALHQAFALRDELTHGHFNPEDVIVGWDGSVKLVGLWAPLGRAAVSERPEAMEQARAYMAPELAEGGAPTAAADVYAVAMLLWSLLSGHSPPEPGERVAPLTELRPDLAQTVSDAISHALEPDPRARAASPVELAAVLEGLAQKTDGIRELADTMEMYRALWTLWSVATPDSAAPVSSVPPQSTPPVTQPRAPRSIPRPAARALPLPAHAKATPVSSRPPSRPAPEPVTPVAARVEEPPPSPRVEPPAAPPELPLPEPEAPKPPSSRPPSAEAPKPPPSEAPKLPPSEAPKAPSEPKPPASEPKPPASEPKPPSEPKPRSVPSPSRPPPQPSPLRGEGRGAPGPPTGSTERPSRLVPALLALVVAGAAAWYLFGRGEEAIETAPPVAPCALPSSPPAPTASIAPALPSAPPPVASAPPPVASAPPPPASASEPELPPVADDPPGDGSALLSFQGYLIVRSPVDAEVVVQGVGIGRTNKKLVSRCLQKNIRLRDPATQAWLSAGTAVRIGCMQTTTLRIDPD